MTNRRLSGVVGCAAIIIMGVLAGCGRLVPPTLPAQLEHTPGPPVRVTDRTYETTVFRTTYPAGWTAISSPAYAPPWVVFASPDERAVIVIAVDAADTQVMPPALDADAATTRHEEVLDLGDGAQVTAVLVTSEDEFALYDELFERVMASVEGV